jgi:hypothetical protein
MKETRDVASLVEILRTLDRVNFKLENQARARASALRAHRGAVHARGASVAAAEPPARAAQQVAPQSRVHGRRPQRRHPARTGNATVRHAGRRQHDSVQRKRPRHCASARAACAVGPGCTVGPGCAVGPRRK